MLVATLNSLAYVKDFVLNDRSTGSDALCQASNGLSWFADRYFPISRRQHSDDLKHGWRRLMSMSSVAATSSATCARWRHGKSRSSHSSSALLVLRRSRRSPPSLLRIRSPLKPARILEQGGNAFDAAVTSPRCWRSSSRIRRDWVAAASGCCTGQAIRSRNA